MRAKIQTMKDHRWQSEYYKGQKQLQHKRNVKGHCWNKQRAKQECLRLVWLPSCLGGRSASRSLYQVPSSLQDSPPSIQDLYTHIVREPVHHDRFTRSKPDARRRPNLWDFPLFPRHTTHASAQQGSVIKHVNRVVPYASAQQGSVIQHVNKIVPYASGP